MNNLLLDLYSDYLSVSFGAATATGLSNLVDGVLSHNAVTRFLGQGTFDSKDLWKQVKSTVCEIVSHEGVLVFDVKSPPKNWTVP